jgi:hypothetical protein
MLGVGYSESRDSTPRKDVSKTSYDILRIYLRVEVVVSKLRLTTFTTERICSPAREDKQPLRRWILRDDKSRYRDDRQMDHVRPYAILCWGLWNVHPNDVVPFVGRPDQSVSLEFCLYVADLHRGVVHS